MSNRFYDRRFNPPVGSQAKGASLVTEYSALEAAFDAVQAELDALGGIAGITSLPGFPASFTGSGLRYLRVNAAESAVEFRSLGAIPRKIVAGTTYTLLASDSGKLLLFTSSSNVTVTVPTAASALFDDESSLMICQLGTGVVTLAPAGGVDLLSSGGLLSCRGQFACITAIYLGSDDWLIGGDRG